MRPFRDTSADLAFFGNRSRSIFTRSGRIHMARIIVASCMVLSFVPPALSQQVDYLLNPGDLLEISVWKEEGMEKDVLVLPDGMISFPLVGHLNAAGITALQLQNDVTERLKKYIPNPVVTVSIKDLGGNKVFVIGEVRVPNVYKTSRRVDVMQALSLAGGLTQYADESDIQILRRNNGKEIAIPFDYNEVKKGRNLESNILLESGDVVVVTDNSPF